jgi:flagellar biosynthetic protein FlhB
VAEDQDEASKTEDPTAKRLSDAREKGHVPMSQDVKHWAMLLAGTGVIGVFGPAIAADVRDAVLPFLERPHLFAVDTDGLFWTFADVLVSVFVALALPLLLLVIAGLASGLAQNGLIFTTTPLEPNLSKLSPLKGAKRIFSTNAPIELAKSVLKMGIIGAVIVAVLLPQLTRPDVFTGMAIEALLAEIFRLALVLLAVVLALQLVVAAVDLAYQRWNHTKQLRMTKTEVKDEYKQLEGDPQVKARIRSLRMDRARRRMMQAVPTADVVVTNPTHYAVALKYEPGEMSAPRLVAKGTDLVALRIREIAEESGVPIVENPPVARALHAAVEIDQEIPPEQYRAVAEIISYVFRLRRRAVPG